MMEDQQGGGGKRHRKIKAAQLLWCVSEESEKCNGDSLKVRGGGINPHL